MDLLVVSKLLQYAAAAAFDFCKCATVTTVIPHLRSSNTTQVLNKQLRHTPNFCMHHSDTFSRLEARGWCQLDVVVVSELLHDAPAAKLFPVRGFLAQP